MSSARISFNKALAFELLLVGDMKTFRRFAPITLAFAALSCQSEPESGNPATTSLITVEGSVSREPHVVFLIVADDANTADGTQLRTQLTQSLRKGLQHEIDERWGTAGNKDPGAWHLGDIRIVLARPSAPDGEALVTSADIPNLAWKTQTSLSGEIDAVIAAASQGLSSRLAMPGETYRPLHATARAVNLMIGARAPENAAETALLGSLPKWFTLHVTVASTRNDEDSLPVTQLVPATSMNDDIFVARYSVVGPSAMGDEGCYVTPFGTSRIESWAERTTNLFIAWPCANAMTLDSIMTLGWADGGPACFSRPLHISSDGSVECKAYIDQPNLDACNAEQGWRDPDGKATIVPRHGQQMRRCEIVQHTGARLEACRHSLDCPDCGSGFCATEVPELVPSSEHCPGTEVAWPLRFTGGALASPEGGYTQLICNTGEK